MLKLLVPVGLGVRKAPQVLVLRVAAVVLVRIAPNFSRFRQARPTRMPLELAELALVVTPRLLSVQPRLQPEAGVRAKTETSRRREEGAAQEGRQRTGI